MNTKIVSLTTLALIGITASAQADTDMTGKEKCYGIVKAGKNDCASKMAGNSCAGQGKKDGQGFIIVPKGTCDKIVGGSTTEK